MKYVIVESCKSMNRYRIVNPCDSIDNPPLEVELPDTRVSRNIGTGNLTYYCNECEDGGCNVLIEAV